MPIAATTPTTPYAGASVCAGCGPTVEHEGDTYCCRACAREAAQFLPRAIRVPLTAAALLGTGALLAARVKRWPWQQRAPLWPVEQQAPGPKM